MFYLYSFNGHGDVTQLTDATGSVIKNYEYDEFGNEINPDPNDTNMFRYCGEYFDKETGTYYLRARYYDPGIGRFTAEDSVRVSQEELLPNGFDVENNPRYKIDDPLSLNLYTYCGNNPIIKVDPDGHLFFLLAIFASAPEWVPVVAGVVTSVISAVTVNEVVVKPLTKSNSKNKKPSSPGDLQKQVEKDQAPKEVDRVDKPHVPGQKPHVHFKNGTSLNNDGTIHDVHKGTPDPSNKTIDWLNKNGWKAGK